MLPCRIQVCACPAALLLAVASVFDELCVLSGKTLVVPKQPGGSRSCERIARVFLLRGKLLALEFFARDGFVHTVRT